MANFGNTCVAFGWQSDKDLQRANLLFRAISSPIVVKFGKIFANMALALHIPLAWLIKPTLYKQFVGGESIDDCIPSVRQLEKFNVKAILDYSAEGGHSISAMEAALDETLRTIKFAASDASIPFAVFKPTAFATASLLEHASKNLPWNENQQSEFLQFRGRINTLCLQAFESGIPILIDAEDVHFQEIVDTVAAEMMRSYNQKKAIVYNTYQMYRTDRLEKLKNDLKQAEMDGYFLGAKFVRGAYMERERARAKKMGYPSPVYESKEATDHNYNAAIEFSVRHIDRISIFNGTHNEESCQYIVQLMHQAGIQNNDPRIWHSQLYGMSDHISFNMAAEGYNVAKYMPYGPVKSVLPYLLRRAEENTSIAGQTGRELGLIRTEITRRKALKGR